MDITRLANVIFQKGEKIHQKEYTEICEAIETDKFSLSEHVAEYKSHDSVLGKNIYLLEDGSKVLVSKELIESINSLDVNKDKLSEYMSKSVDKLKKVLSVISEKE
jgi:hypothetical protein